MHVIVQPYPNPGKNWAPVCHTIAHSYFINPSVAFVVVVVGERYEQLLHKQKL